MSRLSPKLATSTPLAFIPPLAPTLVDEPPAGDNWLHEIKHDGFRTLVLVEHGRARAFSRRGLDWTARYPRIVAAAEAISCLSANHRWRGGVRQLSCRPAFTHLSAERVFGGPHHQ